MLLSARILNNVADVNTFEVVQTLETTQGDAPDIYFSLIDASVNKRSDTPGIRYCAAPGSTLQVVLQDINSGVTLTVYATQPFALSDSSIWRASFDPVANAASIAGLAGTYALKLKLVEPTRTLSGFVSRAINIARTVQEF